MFLIMLYTSASKLLRSSFCGGHFLDLNPKLLFVSLSSSLQSLFSTSTSTSSCIQGNHFCSTVTPHGSRKTTAHSTSPWEATTEQKCVNWLACSFSTDWPTNTGKKVSDSTWTTGSQFSRTPQDHKQNESGKNITRHFKNHGLKITIQTNLKIVNYLDVSFNLTNRSYYPYRKPNNLPQYINIKSNHPPNIIKQLPASINRRFCDNSCNEHEFNKAKPIYDDALKSSGYTEILDFNKHRHPVRQRRNRQRNIIWYNLPFSKSVKTNIGSTFLKLISRHFPRHHKYHSLFNKNNVKVSYSCRDNMQSIINKHNKKVCSIDTKPNSQDQCNCRDKDQCPIDNKCLTSVVIYNARVTTDDTTKNYIGLTEGKFKQRFTQHKHSFRHRSHMNSTELSKYIWQLRDSKKDFNIKWTIICRVRPYSNITKRCDLCTTEKLMIINSKPDELLNKRSELISKCRHENKFHLRNN